MWLISIESSLMMCHLIIYDHVMCNSKTRRIEYDFEYNTTIGEALQNYICFFGYYKTDYLYVYAMQDPKKNIFSYSERNKTLHELNFSKKQCLFIRLRYGYARILSSNPELSSLVTKTINYFHPLCESSRYIPSFSQIKVLFVGWKKSHESPLHGKHLPLSILQFIIEYVCGSKLPTPLLL